MDRIRLMAVALLIGAVVGAVVVGCAATADPAESLTGMNRGWADGSPVALVLAD